MVYVVSRQVACSDAARAEGVGFRQVVGVVSRQVATVDARRGGSVAVLTIKGAEAATGIPAATLRAWERRYAAFRPARSPAGYRLYDERLINDLRVMRDLVAAGHAPREAVAEVAARRGTATPPTAQSGQGSGAGGRRAPAPLPDIAELIAASATEDPALIAAAVDAGLAAALLPVALQEWLLPALAGIGEAWAKGEIGVTAEHMASHSIQRALAARLHELVAATAGPTVLVGVPSGARHELGALAFATLAAHEALRVRYLGTDLPADQWRRAAENTRAAVAVVAVPTTADIAAGRATVAALAEVDALIVAVGGGQQDAVDGAAFRLGHDLPEAVKRLRDLLAGGAAYASAG